MASSAVVMPSSTSSRQSSRSGRKPSCCEMARIRFRDAPSAMALRSSGVTVRNSKTAVLTDGEIGPGIGALSGYAFLIFGLWWMLDGKANRHTANDNTSGTVTLLEIALALPEELRKDVCFVWLDNEERGLLGSRAFAKRHKDAQKKALVVNFDCVGDGDSLQFFPTKKVKKSDSMALLRQSYLNAGEKTTEVVAGFGFYPSDQAAFVHGVGVCALKKSKLFGWYMDRIHTKKDTVLDEENIAMLRAGTVRLLQTMKNKDETHA